MPESVAELGRAERETLRDRGELGQVLLRARLAADRADQLLDDRLGADPALADRRVEAGQVGVAEVARDRAEGVGRHQPLQRQVLLAHHPGDLVLARLDRGLAALLGEPLADLVPGPGALDEVKPVPVGARLLRLGGEDLDRVAVVEGGLERDQAAVDPGAGGAVADVGVDRVGEVDRGGALRQRDDLAAGGEHVDLGPGQVEAEGVEELGRVFGLALPVDELTEPGHLGRLVALLGLVLVEGDAAGQDRAVRDHVFLVLPVRGDAVLGPLVHAPGADLQLDRLAAGADDRGVQALVHVELRHRDVVLEPAGDRVPARVDGAEGRVAVADAVDQDPDADQVVDVVELDVAGDHLLVDRVVVLGAAADRALDPGLVHVGATGR